MKVIAEPLMKRSSPLSSRTPRAAAPQLPSKAEYVLLITQRLVLMPEMEANLYSKEDIGSGLSTLDLGLRLRYELRRERALYVGVVRSGKYGVTADLMRAAGTPVSDTQWLIGVRAWW